jgi:hypothetical protein
VRMPALVQHKAVWVVLQTDSSGGPAGTIPSLAPSRQVRIHGPITWIGSATATPSRDNDARAQVLRFEPSHIADRISETAKPIATSEPVRKRSTS